jgi:tetratricopeptide (TPR) repeat protein
VQPKFNLDDFGPIDLKSQRDQPRRTAPASQSTRSRHGSSAVGITSVSSHQSTSAQPRVNSRDQREMQIMAQRADAHIQQGFMLGQRGALYSARSEFIQALRLLAEAHDARKGSDVHARSLGSGLRALDEAREFIPTGSRLEADIDLASIVSAHRTPVLRSALDGQIRAISPREALDRYFKFAYQHLAFAVGNQSAGSMALYGLGKIAAAEADSDARKRRILEYRATTLLQAAMKSDSRNPLAANELGVLMARYGRYEKAQQLLRHSIALQPQSLVWQNLAELHRRMGQPTLASQAQQQSQNVAHDAGANSPYTTVSETAVQLLDNDSFSRAAPDAVRDPAATQNTQPNNLDGPRYYVPSQRTSLNISPSQVRFRN